MFARALIALAAATLLASRAAGPSTFPVATATPREIALRTQARQPAGTATTCMAALLTGTLVRDGATDIRLRDEQGHAHQVVWPNGYTARDDDGRLAVIDQSGSLVAHEGDRVSVGGGEIDGSGTWLACPGTLVVAP